MAEITEGKVIVEKTVAVAFTEGELKTIIHALLNYRGWAWADMPILENIRKKVFAVAHEFQIKEKE
jgi:hypothetical protein